MTTTAGSTCRILEQFGLVATPPPNKALLPIRRALVLVLVSWLYFALLMGELGVSEIQSHR